MADNFSANNFQGVSGKYKPVLDETVAPTADNFQGVSGKYVPVADEAAGAVGGATPKGPLGHPLVGALGGPI